MSKFRLLDAVLRAQPTSCSLRERLTAAIAIVIDNVAQYVCEGTTQETWDDRKDFPNLAPPFPTMWFEFSPSGRMLTERGLETLSPDTTDYRHGLLVETRDVLLDAVNDAPVANHAEPQINSLQQALLSGGVSEARTKECFTYLRHQGVRWAVSVSWFVSQGKQLLGGPHTICGLIYAVGADGRIVTAPGEDAIIGGPAENYIRWVNRWSPSEALRVLSPNVRRQIRQTAHTAYQVAMLATCFMHCKNVTVIQGGGSGVKSVVNSTKRTHSAVNYHVLEIEPLKQVLRAAGAATTGGDPGLIKALHICRGHFKTYGRPVLDATGQQVVGADGLPLTTPGLFGREHLKGTFWWPVHIRGAASSGVVEKDYDVKL